METLESFLMLVVLVALIVTIVYGVKWFKNRNDKENVLVKKHKKWFWISVIVMIVAFISAGIVEGNIEEAEEEAQTAKEESQYKKDKEEFTQKYVNLAYLTEDLSEKEGNAWNDAIENSDDDFDVSTTIDDITNNNADRISGIEKRIDNLHDIDQKIQDNDSVDASDKDKIHDAYLDVKHFADHATNIAGSYNDFIDEHNELDRKVSDRIEEIRDL